MDLDKFADLMYKRADKLPANVVALKKRVATSAATTVISETPVDTGAAVSSWLIGFGTGRGTAMPPLVPGQKGSTRDENVRMSIMRAVQDINQGNGTLDIHVGNSLDYILDLNRGTSTQAPAGFVESAAIIARRALKNPKLIRD